MWELTAYFTHVSRGVCILGEDGGRRFEARAAAGEAGTDHLDDARPARTEAAVASGGGVSLGGAAVVRHAEADALDVAPHGLVGVAVELDAAVVPEHAARVPTVWW